MAEQPLRAPLSVSPAVFSPTSSSENRRIFSSKPYPSHPDGSDLGPVGWQERDFQPFPLEETESPRVLGSCPVLSPRELSTKFWNHWARPSQWKILSSRGRLAKSGDDFGFHNLQGTRGGSSGIKWIEASNAARQPPQQFSGPKTPIVRRLGNPAPGHTVSDYQTVLFPQALHFPICELWNKSKLF